MLTVRPSRWIIVLAALAATALTAPAAAGSEATISATLTAGPDPVTVGHTAAFTTTFTNTGPVGVHDVELRLDIPDGSTFLQNIPGDANCVLEHGHTVECKFGAVDPGGEIDLTVLVTAPGTTGPIMATAHWGAEHADPQFPTASIDVVPPSADALSEWALPAGRHRDDRPGHRRDEDEPAGDDRRRARDRHRDGDGALGGERGARPVLRPVRHVLRPGLDDHDRLRPSRPAIRCGSRSCSTSPRSRRSIKIKKIPMYHDSVAVADCTGYSGCRVARPVRREPHEAQEGRRRDRRPLLDERALAAVAGEACSPASAAARRVAVTSLSRPPMRGLTPRSAAGPGSRLLHRLWPGVRPPFVA